MRKQLSLKHKVKIVGRVIDLGHTDLKVTFARVRAQLAAQAKVEPVIAKVHKIGERKK